MCYIVHSKKVVIARLCRSNPECKPINQLKYLDCFVTSFLAMTKWYNAF